MRPKDLPPALQNFANANYAPGPTWGGTPQRAAPGAAFLTPGVTLPAENENYLHGNAFDTAQAILNEVGQMPAMNFPTFFTFGQIMNSAAFSDVEQAWYTCRSGGFASIARVPDWGHTAADIALALGGVTVDLGFDTAGNCVTVSNAGVVQDAPFVAYGSALVFVNRGVQVLYAVGQPSQVLYEPANALWCVVGLQNVPFPNTIFAYTSPDRIVWTAHSFGANWINMVGIGGATWPTMGVGNGLVVCAAAQDVNGFRTIRSANGGITWTNDQLISPPGGALANGPSQPTWSAVEGLWYVAIGRGTVARTTFVYSSPDAITWTLATTLTGKDCNFSQMVAFGSMLIGVNDDGRVFAGLNQGTTWYRCGLAGGAVTMGGTGGGSPVRGGGGGIVILSALVGAFSARMGLPTKAA